MSNDGNERRETERVGINLSLSPEAGRLLERIMEQRFPGRKRVSSLTIEQLIREEARRQEQEGKRRDGRRD